MLVRLLLGLVTLTGALVCIFLTLYSVPVREYHRLLIHYTADGCLGFLPRGSFFLSGFRSTQVLIFGARISARYTPKHGSVGSQGCVCPATVHTASFSGHCENGVFLFSWHVSFGTTGIVGDGTCALAVEVCCLPLRACCSLGQVWDVAGVGCGHRGRDFPLPTARTAQGPSRLKQLTPLSCPVTHSLSPLRIVTTNIYRSSIRYQAFRWMLRAQKLIRPSTLSVDGGETRKQVIPPPVSSAEPEKAQGEEHSAGWVDWRKGGVGGGEVGNEMASGGEGAGAEP